MPKRDSKTTTWLIGILTVFLFAIFCFPGLNNSRIVADPSMQKNVLSTSHSNPLIVYYSRSGKTRIAARELAENLS